MAYLPCQNPNCRSKGKAHPNCHCYDHIHGNEKNAITRKDPSVQFPGTTRGMTRRKKRGGGYKYLARGGEVASDNYCDNGASHHPGCPYFAGGGAVEIPHEIHDHSASHSGLLGLLSGSSNTKLNTPDQHVPQLLNMNEDTPPPGHPLVGSMGKENHSNIMAKMSENTAGKHPNPQAFRNSVDFLHSSIKGKDKLSAKINSLFEKTKPEKISPSVRNGLSEKISELSTSPEKMLDIGGDLGHYMPEQAAQMAESVSGAVQYLTSLKPAGQKPGPLDSTLPVSKYDQIKYERALDIAQDPTLVIDYAKNGVLEDSDVIALNTMYPKLAQAIALKATEFLVDKESKGKKLTMAQKRSFSAILGQPMTFVQGPDAIRAIMQANAGAQSETQNQPKKATGVELKQLNKVDTQSANPLQYRQLSRKS